MGYLLVLSLLFNNFLCYSHLEDNRITGGYSETAETHNTVKSKNKMWLLLTLVFSGASGVNSVEVLEHELLYFSTEV